jgi:hypothetical protein
MMINKGRASSNGRKLNNKREAKGKTNMMWHISTYPEKRGFAPVGVMEYWSDGFKEKSVASALFVLLFRFLGRSSSTASATSVLSEKDKITDGSDQNNWYQIFHLISS